MADKVPSEFMSIGDFLSDLKETVFGKHYLDIDEPADDDIEEIFSDAGDQKDDPGSGFDSGEHTDEGEEPEGSDAGDDGEWDGGGGDWDGIDWNEGASTDSDDPNDDGSTAYAKRISDAQEALFGANGLTNRTANARSGAEKDVFYGNKKEVDTPKSDVPQEDAPKDKPSEGGGETNKPDPLFTAKMAYDPSGVRETISKAIESEDSSAPKTDQNPTNLSTEIKDAPAPASSINDAPNGNASPGKDKEITVPIGEDGKTVKGTAQELEKEAAVLEEDSDSFAENARIEEESETPNQSVIDGFRADSKEAFFIANAIRTALAEFYSSRDPREKDYESDLEQLIGNMESMTSEFDMSIE